MPRTPMRLRFAPGRPTDRIFRLKAEATDHHVASAFRRKAGLALALALLAGPAFAQTDRPFGTLREQAEMQQAWRKKRLDTFLPPLMRKHGIDLWIVPMREYNEDPVFPAITAPETFAARRRTIYVFFDKCSYATASGQASANRPATSSCVERVALGGTTQGGV